jgi:hypothetical protein
MTFRQTPLKLFQAFLPESLVDNWVQYTNIAPVPDPQALSQDNVRAVILHGSRPGQQSYGCGSGCCYMQNHKEIRFEDFWKASAPGKGVLNSGWSSIQSIQFNRTSGGQKINK